MTETEASRLLLVRAFEDPPVAPWGEADAKWAGDEALRAEGANASPERLLARRAQFASARLAEREPVLRTLLDARASPGWIASLLALVALAASVANDAVGPSGRVNILAPPLIAILLWNLVVYAVIAWHTLVTRHGAGGPVRRALLRATRRIRTSAVRRSHRHVLARFLRDWGRASAPLNGARIAALMHAAAIAVAFGALASLYLRGLAFEYRAGWDSTFLDAGAVHRLLWLVLGPASALSGIALPDVEHLAALRYSAGFGENAARFIHLHAITVALVVFVPRALLAAFAVRKARRLARDFPLELSDPYFQRLLREASDEPVPVRVLPYSYELPHDAERGLRALFERSLGPRVQLHVADPIPLGSEDAPACEEDGVQVVALFALTATPEYETHGVFLRALRERHAHALVLVDESGFRERFGRDRLEQRRAAWRNLLHDVSTKVAFVDLAKPSGATDSRPQPLSA